MRPEVPSPNAPRIPVRTSGTDELRAVVRRRWKLAAWAFAVPFSVAVGLAAFLPGLYQARAVVMVEPNTEPGAVADDLSLPIEQLTRENLARPRLIDLIRKHQVYPRLTVIGDDAANALRGDIDIETQHVDQANGRVSAAIAVSVRGRDPETIANVANDLAAFYVQAEKLQHGVDVKAAAEELAQAKAQLDAEDAKIKDFDDKNLGELPEQVQLHMASIATLTAQLDTVRANHARAVERLAYSSQPASTPMTELAAQPTAELSPAELELTKAEADLRDLRSRYTDEHPEVIRATREVAVLRARVANSRQRARWSSPPEPAHTANAAAPVSSGSGNHARLDAEARRLDAEQHDLETQIAAAQDATLNAPRRAAERAALLPEVDAARDTYTRQLKRYQDLTLAGAALGRNPFHIFEDAVPGHAQVAPKRARLAILGFIFSLFFAGAAVWLAEQTDHTFHSVRELRAFAGLPVLGTIPRIVATSTQASARRWAHVVSGAAVASVVVVLVFTWFWASGNEALVRMFFRR